MVRESCFTQDRFGYFFKTIKSVILRESVEVAGVEALDVCRMKERSNNNKQ